MNTSAVDAVNAEWAQQDAVLLAWPHRASDWADLLHQAEPAFTQMAATISQHEPAIIICQNTQHQTYIEQQLKNSHGNTKQIHYLCIPTNDIWARDFGPIGITRNHKTELLNFEFNGWGSRYPCDLDNQINQQLQRLGVFAKPLIHCNLILEGGSIESDGSGTLLTTSQCLLNQNRNAFDKALMQHSLQKWLPASRILWLESGYLSGDDTDAHIDNLARFASPSTIIHSLCSDPKDEHFTPLHNMQQELAAFKTNNGQPYRLVPIPLPPPIYSAHDGRRLPASYANFLIINNAVLVPQFKQNTDKEALDAISQCFPGRKAIGINSLPFIEQNGGIHCLTMQLAAGTLSKAILT